MSGGGNKKKPTRAQGWEEAGSEFYQESYPMDAEFEALPRDPKYLTTLLPSKQTRAVATTIRIRTNDNRTMRRQTSSRSRRESTVHRRTSTVGDVQVSMLPDLSENLSNEQTTWEKIMLIKSMPIPMLEKRGMKAEFLNEPNLRLQGYEQFKWKRRKMWKQFQDRLKESYANLELWKGALKRIEGYFGTGVVSYFLFLKYLLFLNLFIFSMVFLFITLPTVLLVDQTNQCNSENRSDSYMFLDVLQGTGFMECSLLFYGFYPNRTFSYNDSGTIMYYNLPLAYICISLVCLLVSLVSIVKAAAKGFKERLIEGEGQFYQYCNLVFGGWDFCIHNEKTAIIKHKAIFNEIKGCLEVTRLAELKLNQTRNEKMRLIFIRIVVNIIVLSVLGACGCAIYYVFDFSNSQISNRSSESFLDLFYEYLPSITIVCFNVLVPFSFRYLVTFENYTPNFVIRLTLGRTVLLRLASIYTLYASLSVKIKDIPCWETYVGQQIYKLVLTDFATHVILTFLINFPRALLAKHIKNNFFKFIGEQSFDLPKHVLDVVYSQTLCWLGIFYAPLLSLMFVLIFIIVFYIKKFACLVNCIPSRVIYRASRSNSMFLVVLLLSFISVLLPLAYSVSELTPSEICGPFSSLPSVWSLIVVRFMETPEWLQNIVFFLSTSGFAIPVFILLFLLLYYYRAISSANRHMVNVLKNQLVLEGHDKQFLLERLSNFMKQQQENQKRLRRVDVLQDGDTNISSN